MLVLDFTVRPSYTCIWWILHKCDIDCTAVESVCKISQNPTKNKQIQSGILLYSYVYMCKIKLMTVTSRFNPQD